MGADIYLNSVFNPNHARHSKAYVEAVNERDELLKAGKDDEARRIQRERVVPAYGAMYAMGYYRDSYNESSLLSFLGLSWWQLCREIDSRQGYNDDGTVSVPEMQAFLRTLQRTPVTDQRVTDFLASNGRGLGWLGSPEKTKAYFEAKHKALCALLEQAIALDEGLVFSC